MIIGNYYINNVLLAAIAIGLLGGIGYIVGIPGGNGADPSGTSEDYELVVQGEGLNSGGSQVMRLVSANGSAVTGADIFVNGEDIGETGENGVVSFQVPESSNVTVSASKSGIDVSRTFELVNSEDKDPGNNSDDENQNDQGDEEEQEEPQDEENTDGGNQDNDTGGGKQGENETRENETTIKPSIEKVQPSSLDLESATFEAVFDIKASNASYSIKLGGEEEASGNLDGEITVSPEITLSENGTSVLEASITRGDELLVSENYTVNYSEASDGQQDEPAEVNAALEAPSEVDLEASAGFDASGSSGDILNYSWSFGDGTQRTTDSASVQHTYGSEGAYEVTVAVNGENNTEDSASATVQVLGQAQPSIEFLSPVDDYETSQTSIEYEFEVENAASSAEYSVMVDGSEQVTGSLEEGNSTVQRTVEVPENLFNTSIRVQQDEETFETEKRMVNVSQSSSSGPEFSLNSPQEGETLESADAETSVLFEYEIVERKRATSANLTLRKDGSKVVERPVTVFSGTHTEEVSGLGFGEYVYELELLDGENAVSQSKGFSIRQQSMEDTVSVVSPEGSSGSPASIGAFDVEFKAGLEHDGDAVFNASIVPVNDLQRSFESCENGEKTTTTISYSAGEGIYSHSSELNGQGEYNLSFSKTHYIKGLYKWEASLLSGDGEVLSSSSYNYYNVTEQPDLAAEGSCDGQSQ